MYNKKDFFRLLGAKEQFDDYLFWIFLSWYKEKNNTEAGDGPYYSTVEVIEVNKHTQTITLKFDSEFIYDIPMKYMHERDNTPQAIMLWYSDYYDGPLSGLAEYDGKKCWYQCTKMEDDYLFDVRMFGLYELSPEELKYEEEWHQFFCDKVGLHCNYIDGMHGKTTYDKKSADEFFTAAEKRPDRDYTKNKLIAEVDEAFFQRGYPEKVVDTD